MSYLVFIYIIIAIFIIYLTILGIHCLIEPYLLNITDTTIELDSSTSDNLNTEDLNIIFFSDLHMSYCFIKTNVINKLLEDEYKKGKVDALVFGGDIVNSENQKHYDKASNFFSKINNKCKDLDIPFIGVTGNHDIVLSDTQISNLDFDNINNDYRIYQSKDNTTEFAFIGLGDTGRKNRVWYDIPKIPSSNGKPRINVLVVHNPDYILNINNPYNININAMLSGHIHGGQIKTHSKVEFLVLRKDILPKKNIVSGLYHLNDIWLFISKGIGCVKFPVRFHSKPEINKIHIVHKSNNHS